MTIERVTDKRHHLTIHIDEGVPSMPYGALPQTGLGVIALGGLTVARPIAALTVAAALIVAGVGLNVVARLRRARA